MAINLTKDADKLICLIYKEYLRRRAAGSGKKEAANFMDSDRTGEAFSDFPDCDLQETLNELKDAGLIKIFIYGDFELDTSGVIYMEQRFPNGVSQVLEWLAKIKSAIPFA